MDLGLKCFDTDAIDNLSLLLQSLSDWMHLPRGVRTPALRNHAQGDHKLEPNSPFASPKDLADVRRARHSPSLAWMVLCLGGSKECPRLSGSFLRLSMVRAQHVLAPLQQEV